MLISPINLCFTSRGLLAHSSSADRAAGVEQRDDCLQICLSYSLSCVPRYICMKKKRCEKQSLSRALTIISKRQTAHSNVSICHLGPSFSLKSIPFFYSILQSIQSIQHVQTVIVIPTRYLIWYETTLYV